MTPEGKVKLKVTNILKKMGAYYFFPATGGYGRSGVPDIVACLEGQFVAIECKSGKNTMTALQEREMKNILAANGVGLCVNEANVGVLEQALKNLSSTIHKALSTCASGTGQGVLVVVAEDRVQIHGLNIVEVDAVELLRVAIHSYKQPGERTLQ
jgi:Archaeal holliday junction resolvase (hjc)